MAILFVGTNFLSPSLTFSADELIGAIQWDVRVASQALDQPPFAALASDPFFTQRTAPGAYPFDLPAHNRESAAASSSKAASKL